MRKQGQKKHIDQRHHTWNFTILRLLHYTISVININRFIGARYLHVEITARVRIKRGIVRIDRCFFKCNFSFCTDSEHFGWIRRMSGLSVTRIERIRLYINQFRTIHTGMVTLKHCLPAVETHPSTDNKRTESCSSFAKLCNIGIISEITYSRSTTCKTGYTPLQNIYQRLSAVTQHQWR